MKRSQINYIGYLQKLYCVPACAKSLSLIFILQMLKSSASVSVTSYNLTNVKTFPRLMIAAEINVDECVKDNFLEYQKQFKINCFVRKLINYCEENVWCWRENCQKHRFLLVKYWIILGESFHSEIKIQSDLVTKLCPFNCLWSS